MQSDELEELQTMIENRVVPISDAVMHIANFAQTKIKLDLSGGMLQAKLDSVCDNFDPMRLRGSLEDLEVLETQMKDIDTRIKVITNRC